MYLLVLSDIHLDALGSCSQHGSAFGKLFCDTYPALYELLLGTLGQTSFSRCIYLGDTPAHGRGADFELIREVFATLNCQGYALGNNDAARNYVFDEQRLQQFQALDRNFQPSGLYFNEEFAPELEFVGLNSVLLRYDDEFDQLDFLRQRLDACRAAHKYIIIGAHIPVGVNVMLNDYWGESVRKAYLAMLASYEDVILAELTGHFHIEFWRFYGRVPGFVNPGISPSNGNLPGFRVYSLARDSQRRYLIEDYQQFYCEINALEPQFELQYRFRHMLPYLHSKSEDITGTTLRRMAQQQAHNGEFASWRIANRAMMGMGGADLMRALILAE